MQVLAGPIQSMKTVSGPYESSIESLINYTIILYFNTLKEIKKNQLNYAQTEAKNGFFPNFDTIYTF